MKSLRIALRNLVRNRRRTTLAALSIGVSIFIFAALMSLPSVVNQVLRDRAESLRLVSYNKAGFFYTLPAAYKRRIEAVPHVEAVTGESLFMGTYRDPRDLIPSAAIDPDNFREIWPDWGISAAAAEEFARTRSGALVSKGLMRRFGWKVGDRIMLRGTIYPLDLELIVVAALGDKAPPVAVLFQREHLEEMLGRPGTVNLFWIKVDSSKSIPGVKAAIDEKFANSSAETRTETELGISLSQMSSYRILFDGMKWLAAIVMFAIAMVAANTAAMSVRERRKEIAIMRSIGFSREIVLASLLCEGLLIGIAGGLIGCAMAFAALRLLPFASHSLGLLALAISLPKRVLAESFALAAVIGFGSDLVPAIAAIRREVSGELRAVV